MDELGLDPSLIRDRNQANEDISYDNNLLSSDDQMQSERHLNNGQYVPIVEHKKT